MKKQVESNKGRTDISDTLPHSHPGSEPEGGKAHQAEEATGVEIGAFAARPLNSEEDALRRFSSLDDLVLILSPEGRILEANVPALTQLAFTRAQLEGSALSILYPEASHGTISSRLHAMSLHTSADFVETVRTCDGFIIPMQTRLSWGEWQRRRVIFWVSRGLRSGADSSYAINAHAHEFFQTIYHSAAVPVIFFNLNGRILEMNEAFLELTGKTRESLLYQNFHDLLQAEDIPLHMQRIQKIIDGEINHSQQYEEKLAPGGTVIHLSCLLLLIRDNDGQPMYFINHLQNVTTQKQVEQQLQHMATHDPLTNLPNRTMIQDRFQHAVSIARRSGKLISLVCLDLDNFKLINDTYGHEAGDQILIHISDRLRSAVRESDTIARIGGDEFVILLEGMLNSRDALKVLEKTLDILAEPIEIDNHQFSISASAGISTFPFDGETLAQLLPVADFAMYQAKEQGDGRIGLPENLVTRTQLSMFNLDEANESNTGG